MNYYNEFDANAADWLENLIKEGLIPNGKVDRRSIAEVSPDDLRGFTQCHFFAGVSGWAIALRLAGWDDSRECWSGSCPCQPWSVAGKGEGAEDERHLWPEFFRLIKACRPPIIFGEQVASSDVVGKVDRKNGIDPEEPPVWLDGVSTDLEGASFAFTAFDLPAACINAPHIRQRIWWLGVDCGLSDPERTRWSQAGSGSFEHAGRESVAGYPDSVRMGNSSSERAGRHTRTAFGEKTEGGSERIADGLRGGNGAVVAGPVGGLANNDGQRLPRRTQQNGIEEQSELGASRRVDVGGCGEPDGMGNTASERRNAERNIDDAAERNQVEIGVGGSIDGMGDSSDQGSQGRSSTGCSDQRSAGSSSVVNPWSDYRIVHCTDERNRRVSAQSGDEPLAAGIPSKSNDPRMGFVLSELGKLGFDSKDSKRLLREARRNRVVRLRGYGNSIVPQVAVEFIRAFMEIE